MTYKIAVASSDEQLIDETFGGTNRFIIYEVSEQNFKKKEVRTAIKTASGEGLKPEESCKSGGCGTAGNCGQNSDITVKVKCVGDCRCVVCKKIGFQVQKELERKAISYFDISCPVTDALEKIAAYYQKIDNQKERKTKL